MTFHVKNIFFNHPKKTNSEANNDKSRNWKKQNETRKKKKENPYSMSTIEAKDTDAISVAVHRRLFDTHRRQKKEKERLRGRSDKNWGRIGG